MTRELDDLVRSRASNRCEYCQFSQDHHGWKFEIDHVIAEKHNGPTEAENLALCCPKCNQHKGPNIAGIDPQARAIVPLFHPRHDKWSEHFHWDGAVLEGITPAGRATIAVLNINDPVRVAARQALIVEGVFPPV